MPRTTAGSGVQCIVCASTGNFSSNDDGFLVCGVCGTLAANVANESSDLADGGHLVERLLQRKAAAPAVRPTRDGSKRKRRRNATPSPPPHATVPSVERNSQAACLSVASTLLQTLSRALAAATGEHLLEENVKSLWTKYAASLVVVPGEKDNAETNNGKTDDGDGDDPDSEDTRGGDSVQSTGSEKLAALPSLECLVALCCIALRQSRSAIQVPEIVRLCLSGRVPFYGAFDDLDPAIRSVISSEHYGELRPSRVLTCSSLGSAMERVRVALHIDQLAPPNVHAVVRRYCNELKVPRDVATVAAQLVRAVPIEAWCTDATTGRVGLTAFPVAVSAMAYIFVALKYVYGLDGVTEYACSEQVVGSAECSLRPIGEWLDAVGDPRLGDAPGDVVAWSTAALTAATSHHDVFRHFSTPRMWQSIGSCYTNASRWSSAVEVDDARLSPYLRWAGNEFVPESRRTTFRQKHCLQLHDFGDTFGRLAEKWDAKSTADDTVAAASAETDTATVMMVGEKEIHLLESSSTIDIALNSRGSRDNTITHAHTQSLEVPTKGTDTVCSSSSDKEPEYTRLGYAAADDEGGTYFPEALRVVARILASHVLESDALLFQALHVLETEALSSATLL